MATSFEYDVFLSYKSQDSADVLELAHRLQSDGLRVWLDALVIQVGDPIQTKIEEGLQRSRMLILCMSAHTFSSDWQQLEVGTFRFRDPLNKNRRFIPLRLDDAAIPDSLRQFQFVDWRNKSDSEYQKLLAVCRAGAGDLTETLLTACQRQTAAALKHLQRYRKIVTECYVERKLDLVFDKFLKDATASCIVIVDDPGTGKTSLLAHQAVKTIEERGVPAVFLSTDEYLATGRHCRNFEEFVLKAIQPGLTAGSHGLSRDATMDDLLSMSQQKPGLPRLLIVLDALNEIHAADQATRREPGTRAVDSNELLRFIKSHAPTDVKLLISSRKVTWMELYTKDSGEWKEHTWRPEWTDLYSSFFLGGLRPKEFVGSPTMPQLTESAPETLCRIVELPLGPFDELELCLALGRYQARYNVRVVPGDAAFEELKDPFFLGLCFFVWDQERSRRAVRWHHVEPKDVTREEGDRWLLPLNALEWFELSASYWEESVNRLIESLTLPENTFESKAGREYHTKVEQFKDRMVRQMWETGSDRIPVAELTDLREGSRGEQVYQAMLRQDMIVYEGPEEDVLVKFPRDRIAAFHIVRTLRDRLRYAHRFAEPVGEFLRFVETSEKHDLFAGLTPHVLRLCGQFAPTLPKELLPELIWRSAGQPGWFVVASVCLAQLDPSHQLEMVPQLLCRFLTWLLPAEPLGLQGEPADYQRTSALLERLAEGKDDGKEPLAQFLTLDNTCNLRIARSAIEALRRLGEICPPALADNDPRRELARGMVDAVIHAFRQHSEIDKDEKDVDRWWGALSPEHEIHALANDLYKASLFQEAVEFYRLALELRPDLLETYFNLGLALTRLCEYVAAESCLDRVIELDPQWAEAYYTRGLIREYRNNFDGALTDYARALEVDPGYGKATKQMEVVRAKLGGGVDGERLQSPAWQLFAEAMDLTKKGDVEHARARLQRARELGIDFSVRDLQQLAESLWMNGFVSLAVDNYLALLSLAALLTRHELADLLLAVSATCGDRQDDDKSLEYALAATAANPDIAAAYNNIASMLVCMGTEWTSPEAAIREAETALRLDKTLTGSLLTEAAAYERLGNTREAMDCLNAAAARRDFSSASALATLAWEYSTDVPAVERRKLLEDAAALFLSEQDEARSRYVLESVVEWWYIGAKVMAQLGRPEYREFRTKARTMLSCAKEIMPCDPVLGSRVPRDQFFKLLDDLDQLYHRAES